jgi:hypothetical protein
MFNFGFSGREMGPKEAALNFHYKTACLDQWDKDGSN